MRGGESFGIRRSGILVGALLGAALMVTAWGCADTMIEAPTFDRAFFDASTDASDLDVSSADDPPGCVGPCGVATGTPPSCPPGSPLDCYVDTTCATPTTITGTVFDPAGKNPLANVAVYIPSDPNAVAPITTGTSSCDSCATVIHNAVVLGLTDATGKFELRGAPDGANVPLFIQIGKWRRKMTVPKVVDCQTTQLPISGTGQPRLPRKRSEGTLPQMALLTGGCDNVACFLQNVGVDASEFSAPRAGGRVDVYQGLGATGPAAALSNGVAGDCTTAACPLWSSKQALEAYDAVFLGCECSAHDETKPAASLQAMHDWLGEGGKVFATHSQATWFENGPADFQSLATWTNGPASGATGPFVVNTSWTAGASLESWLASVGAADDGGVVALDPANVSTSVTTVSSIASAWIADTSTADGGVPAGDVKAFTARTPLDAGGINTCGAIHFADIHPGGSQAVQGESADGSSTSTVPAACPVRDLSAGEKLLEYLLFDQTACIGGTTKPPPPPVSPGL